MTPAAFLTVTDCGGDQCRVRYGVRKELSWIMRLVILYSSSILCVGEKKPTADFFMRYWVGRFSAKLGISPAAFFFIITDCGGAQCCDRF